MLSLSEAEEAYPELSLNQSSSFSLSSGFDNRPISFISLTSSELTSAMFTKSKECCKGYPSNQIGS